jgi:ribosomal protein S18 acetylase RimI-like enzyme
LFGVRDGGRLLAVVAVNGEQSRRYASVDWADAKGNPAVIHRLAVHPDVQGRGLGRRLLQFAEHQARSKGCSSVRLDVYSDNEHAVRLYERHGYSIRGEIRFPFRPAVYYAMEKSLP